MFAEERPALTPLPVEPFRYYAFGTRAVHLDGFIEVEAAYYAPPPGYIGRELQALWDGRAVRIIDSKTRQLMREHLRREGGGGRSSRRTGRVGNHDPPWNCSGERAGRAEASAPSPSASAKPKASPACAASRGSSRSHGSTGRPPWTTPAPRRLGLRQVDPLIRQLTEFRDVIQRMTRSLE